tara:strand:- start:115 stop:375 length:261 start_codon:yes stop_codon:yes gene_type:complete
MGGSAQPPRDGDELAIQGGGCKKELLQVARQQLLLLLQFEDFGSLFSVTLNDASGRLAFQRVRLGFGVSKSKWTHGRTLHACLWAL